LRTKQEQGCVNMPQNTNIQISCFVYKILKHVMRHCIPDSLGFNFGPEVEILTDDGFGHFFSNLRRRLEHNLKISHEFFLTRSCQLVIHYLHSRSYVSCTVDAALLNIPRINAKHPTQA